jgi:hypothetical protein
MNSEGVTFVPLRLLFYMRENTFSPFAAKEASSKDYLNLFVDICYTYKQTFSEVLNFADFFIKPAL